MKMSFDKVWYDIAVSVRIMIYNGWLVVGAIVIGLVYRVRVFGFLLCLGF